METHRNLIGGNWAASRTGRTFEDENPSLKGSVLGLFQASDPSDIAFAVDAAQAAFPAWRETPVRDRQDAVGRFLALLAIRGEELARIVALENGKTFREASTEVSSALAEGTYHQQQVSRFFGHTLPTGTRGMTGWVQYHALGVAAVICPWNFPVNVVCRKALPALLTGNTVVFKPASFTPWSGIFLAELFLQAGFPPGVFNSVTGSGAALGDALVEDPRVKAITFTGSTEVGRSIQRKAGARLVRTQLELGGKNALIVMDDADLEAAGAAAMVAGFACSGQWCTSTSRILVHAAVYDRFLDSLRARCDAMKVGDPLNESTDMGPVAGPAQYGRIMEAIALAESQGARRLTVKAAGGGSADLPDGYFIRPTLFADVTPAMSLFREEVFGPVLAVTPFSSLEDALRLANDSSYGLSSAIFTRDLTAALAYVDGIEAGLAHVNINTGIKDPSLPFGGWKESGFGLPENDVSGLEFFVNRKAVYMSGGQARRASSPRVTK
ncbi:MAG: aldehyde dehydrogenase family protein [Spirochaetia bacterium]